MANGNAKQLYHFVLHNAKQLVCGIPSRSTTLMAMDGNGRTGAHTVGGITSLIESPAVGQCGAEEENFNGKCLREAMEMLGMTLVNTFACGSKTFYSATSDAATRVDYWACDERQPK